MDCSACGYKNLPDNVKFCAECGAKIMQASKSPDVQIQISQITRNSEAIGINVGTMNANTLTINSQAKQNNFKDNFCGLVEWISEKSLSLENLHPAYGKEILRIIQKVKNLSQNSQNYLDFTTLEIQVLDLVFNYCHYYLQSSIPRSTEFCNFAESDYYEHLISLIKSGEKIRVNHIKLSSLIAEKRMSKLVQKLEEDI